MNEPASSWPGGVVDPILDWGLADTLDAAAVDLALGQHRVDQGAEIVDRGVATEGDLAGPANIRAEKGPR
jgi:hypothetical protein